MAQRHAMSTRRCSWARRTESRIRRRRHSRCLGNLHWHQSHKGEERLRLRAATWHNGDEAARVRHREKWEQISYWSSKPLGLRETAVGVRLGDKDPEAWIA